jgi:hypothetical protein
VRIGACGVGAAEVAELIVVVVPGVVAVAVPLGYEGYAVGGLEEPLELGGPVYPGG